MGREMRQETEYPTAHECVGDLKCDACHARALENGPQFFVPGKTVKEIPLGKVHLGVDFATGTDMTAGVLIKGRAVGKSTEPPEVVPLQPIYDVGSHYPIGWKDSEGNYYSRNGERLYPKHLEGDTPMAVVSKVEIRDEGDGEPVLVTEGVEVEYERTAPVGIKKLTEITECDDEDS